MKKHLIGDTIQITWVNSGITPSDLYCATYTGSETLVDSGTMVSSGNGHYYHDHTISSLEGYYVSETLATINGKPYKNRIKFKAVTGEVD